MVEMLVFTAALWVMVCMVKTERTNGGDARLYCCIMGNGMYG